MAEALLVVIMAPEIMVLRAVMAPWEEALITAAAPECMIMEILLAAMVHGAAQWAVTTAIRAAITALHPGGAVAANTMTSTRNWQ